MGSLCYASVVEGGSLFFGVLHYFEFTIIRAASGSLEEFLFFPYVWVRQRHLLITVTIL